VNARKKLVLQFVLLSELADDSATVVLVDTD